MLQHIKNGHRYMQLWPNHACVGNLAEARVIPATRFGWKAMPVAALANAFVQFSYLGPEFMPQILAATIFILLLPLQGYYWLGKRAYTQLPLALRSWYFELQEKLNAQGADIRLPSDRQGPCYIDLARVLRKALNQLPPHEF